MNIDAGKFDAVMFDLDGTLLDTLEDLADSMNAVLEARGHPVHPVDAYRYFVGDGMTTLIRRALPEDARDEATILAAAAEMREVYAARWDEKSTSYGGIPEMLEDLSSQGLRLCVLSNKPDAFTKLCVAKLLDGDRFEIVRGVVDGGPKKPDPAGAIGIAAEMGIPTERFLYLGDTNTDMKTANGAGMHAIGAAWGFRTEEELVESGARVVIHHPSELVGLL
ncbi:MAG: HAD family hydrolase [Planctomycetota bacterium]